MIWDAFFFASIFTLVTGTLESNANVDTWLTSSDLVTGNPIKLLERQAKGLSLELFSHSDSQSQIQSNKDLNEAFSVNVNVNISETLQTIVGYGAGLPQSSAFVLIQLKQRNLSLYRKVMERMFGSGPDDARISALRFPVGSCDFSLQNTSFDEHVNDFDLSWFALDADSEFIVQVLLDAIDINPNITLIASPWSPPSWMKTLGSLIAESEENTLIDSEQVYSSYGAYFGKVVATFESRQLKIAYVTLQNEPLFGTSTEYPGMYLDAKQAGRLARHVRAALPAGVDILAYDHNWDHPEYPISVIATAPRDVAGVAWHCYGGDMASALDRLQALHPYPAFPQHITECTGGFPDNTCDITQGLSGFGYNHEWDMQNVFLGAASHFAVSGVKWILALDEHCGPTLPLVSWKSGRPVVSIPTNAARIEDVRFNQDYWTLSHMSRFVLPGSMRVHSKTVAAPAATGSDATPRIFAESFISNNSRRVSMIVMNTDKNSSALVHVSAVSADSISRFSYLLPAFSTAVFQWN